MAIMPPQPPLDAVPPSPGQLQAQPQPTPIGPPGGPQGPPDLGGSDQIFQMGLQVGAEIAKGLDLLSQAFPQLAGLASSMQAQLKAALKTALQQGSNTPETGAPSAPMAPDAMGGPAVMQGLAAGRLM